MLAAAIFEMGTRRAAGFGGAPHWWDKRNVLASDSVPDDFALINQGQLKQLATAAYFEFEEKLPGGAGGVLKAVVGPWVAFHESAGVGGFGNAKWDHFAPVNVGQLKAVVAPFYNRLLELGLCRGIPWGEWGESDDFALANIGQAKALFSFNPDSSADSDGNGLPDVWELAALGHLGVNPDADADGDGLSNKEEFLQRTSPTDWFNGSAVLLKAVSGDSQEGTAGELLREPFVVEVTTVDGLPVANAPVIFRIVTGKETGAFEEADGVSPVYLQKTVRTDEEGRAKARLRLPALSSFFCRIEVRSGPDQKFDFNAFVKASSDAAAGEAILHAGPDFSTDGGVYSKPFRVVMRSGYPDAKILFTTNGEEPGLSDLCVPDGGSVEINQSTIFRARVLVAGKGLGVVKSTFFGIGRQLYSSSTHTLGIGVNGRSWSWGGNVHGELGLGHNVFQSAPAPIPYLGEVSSGAVGDALSVVATSRGEVLCWGQNSDGQFGRESPLEVWLPQLVFGLPPVRWVAAGGAHCAAVGVDGSVWTWGGGTSSQLGTNGSPGLAAPARVGGIGPVQSVAAGSNFTLALGLDGTVWAWGAGDKGQLGNGSLIDSKDPVRVSGLKDVVSIAAGSLHAIALKGDGTVWTWGLSDPGDSGAGSTRVASLPREVSGINGKGVAIAAGSDSSMVLRRDDAILGWGRSFNSGSGDGTANAPVRVTGRSSALAGALRVLVSSSGSGNTGLPSDSSAGGGEGTAPRAIPKEMPLMLRIGRAIDTNEEEYVFRAPFFFFKRVYGARLVPSSGALSEFIACYSIVSSTDSSPNDDDNEGADFDLIRRESAGDFDGPPAESIEALQKRNDFTMESKARLIVEVKPPDSGGGMVSQACDVDLFVSQFTGGVRASEEKIWNLPPIPTGSNIRLRVAGVTNFSAGGYFWRPSLTAYIGNWRADQPEGRFDRMYQLFKLTNGAKNCECLGQPGRRVMSFSEQEAAEYLMCPVLLKDLDEPLREGREKLISPLVKGSSVAEENVAWIKAHASADEDSPRMPRLTLQIPGLPEGVVLEAKLEVSYNRGNGLRAYRNREEDRVVFPKNGEFREVRGNEWEMWREFEGVPFFGGDACVSFRLMQGGKQVVETQSISFRIGGMNPDPIRCRKFIQSQPDAAPSQDLWFAYAIARSESRSYNGEGSRYNQFLSLPFHQKDAGLPLFGDDRNGDGSPRGAGGYGMFQVTTNADLPRGQIWNWQENVAAALGILRQKRQIAWDWMNSTALRVGANFPDGQRPQAIMDMGWPVPVPDRTVGTRLFSDDVSSLRLGPIEDAVAIKAYNSAVVHYCFWGGKSRGWRFNNTNGFGFDYVSRVCGEVESE